MPTPGDQASLFGALFEKNSDAILLADSEGQVVLVNRACEKLLGYDSDTLCDLDVDALVPSRFTSHARQRKEYGARPLARQMGSGLELFIRHRNGHEIPVDISLTPIETSGKTFVACTIRDLRTRVKVPEDLRVQTTALRSAANGIVITDRRGIIIWVNPAASEVTGYAPNELVGNHTRMLKSGEHDEEFYAALWQTILRGEVWSGTIVNRRKDGTKYHESQTIAPVIGEDGTITHFIAIKQDVTEEHRMRDDLARAHADLEERAASIEMLNGMLREQAIRDPLTSLYNRRYLEETLKREVASVARTGHTLAIAAIDIDHFKMVNDSWGHAAGDRVLRLLADLLASHVRTSDLVCRIGGEEFLVLMPGVDEDVAASRADGWRKAFAEICSQVHEGFAPECTMSIGISTYSGPPDTIETCQRQADEALYEAKRAGRNRVVVFKSSSDPVC